MRPAGIIIAILCMQSKQLLPHQESLAATYGAGISNACVVNMGATTTRIACVDEGLVIPDTRYDYVPDTQKQWRMTVICPDTGCR